MSVSRPDRKETITQDQIGAHRTQQKEPTKVEQISVRFFSQIIPPGKFKQLAHLFYKPQSVRLQSKAKRQERLAVFNAYQNRYKRTKAVPEFGDFTEVRGTTARDKKKLGKHLKRMDKILQKEPKKRTKTRNDRLLKEIRSALSTKAYQQIKEDEFNPATRMLHDLCLSGYFDTKVMPAYQELAVDLQGGIPDEVPHHKLAEELDAKRKMVTKKGGHVVDMKSPRYLLENPRSAVGALRSQKASLGYDPRGNLDNNAGAFFHNTLKAGDAEIQSRHFFTPSWRIGTKVPPEAHAVLQAMENRQTQEVPERFEYPLQICFNNAQNLLAGTERENSNNVMALRAVYPNAFRGVTLPCDSQLATRGLGHGSKMWEKIDQKPDWKIFENFRSELLTRISRNKQIEEGYYFGEENEWDEALPTIIHSVCSSYRPIYKRYHDSAMTERTPEARRELWMVQTAMIEEINFLISIKNQMIAAKILKEKGLPAQQGVTSVCKELADRGSARSVLQYYATSKVNEDGTMKNEDTQNIFAANQARSMMARYRIALDHRLQGMYAVMQLRSPNAIQETMKTALEAEVENYSEV